MKLRIDEYTIKSSKIKEKKKIVFMSDLHINLKMNKKIFKLINEYLKQNDDLDLIAIPGDLMYSWQYANPKYIELFNNILSSLTPFAPVTLSLGNHDIQNEKIEQTKEILKYFKEIKDVYPLDDEQIKINGLTITGFSPHHDVYNPKFHGDKANKRFVEDFQKSKLKFNENEFNILLNHAPHPIASDYTKNNLPTIFEAVDLILAGHLHNGYVPNFIENLFKIKDYGLWEKFSFIPPFFLKKINLCRGIHSLGKSNLIITKGVRKYNGFLPSFIPTNPNITVINILPN